MAQQALQPPGGLWCGVQARGEGDRRYDNSFLSGAGASARRRRRVEIRDEAEVASPNGKVRRQMIRPKVEKLDPLTSLRFFAAFMIVLHHSRGSLIARDFLPGWPLDQGVSFF